MTQLFRFPFCLMMLLVFSSVPAAFGQTLPPALTASSAATAAAPGLKRNPEDLIREFEPAVEEEYTLDAGDEFTLEVQGRPELSGKHVVGPDGQVTLPVVGPFRVRGMTREQTSKAILAALSNYYYDLNATVRIDKYGSNRVLLLGHVVHPGVISFDRTPTLLEAITMAGGVPAKDANHESIPERCVIYRNQDQILWVDVKQLLHSGSSAVNMRLRRNDLVYVPDEADQYVSVLGEVSHPGAIAFEPHMSLPQAFALAGGATERASNTRIQFYRPSTGLKKEFTLADLNSAKVDLTLQAGDVLYVPRSGLSKFGFFMQQISPTTSILMMGSRL